jgi:hypothetical protein
MSPKIRVDSCYLHRGQVRLFQLVRLQTDNLCLFLRNQTDKQTINFRVHDEQRAIGTRKIACASVVHLERPHIYIYTVHIPNKIPLDVVAQARPASRPHTRA